MSASEFLRKVTASEIAHASDESDTAADEARGEILTGPAYRDYMQDRLRNDYPGLHQRIADLIEGQRAVSPEALFLMGVFAGATMVAHDITVTAEAHDARQASGESSDNPTA